MSKYNFKNVNLGHGNNHFGDVYTSYTDFLNQKKYLSHTGIEIAKAIFEHMNSDEGRETLLNSLEKIDSNEKAQINPNEKSIWIKFRDKLIDKGLDESAETVKLFLLQSGPFITEQFAKYFSGQN